MERVSAPVATLQGIRIALHHGVSVYDAISAALAGETELPLVTADDRLVWALAGSSHDVRLLDDIVV